MTKRYSDAVINSQGSWKLLKLSVSIWEVGWVWRFRRFAEWNCLRTWYSRYSLQQYSSLLLLRYWRLIQDERNTQDALRWICDCVVSDRWLPVLHCKWDMNLRYRMQGSKDLISRQETNFLQLQIQMRVKSRWARDRAKLTIRCMRCETQQTHTESVSQRSIASRIDQHSLERMIAQISFEQRQYRPRILVWAHAWTWITARYTTRLNNSQHPFELLAQYKEIQLATHLARTDWPMYEVPFCETRGIVAAVLYRQIFRTIPRRSPNLPSSFFDLVVFYVWQWF